MSTKFIKQFLGNHLHELIGFSFALGEDMSQCEGIVTDSILAYSFEQEMNHFDESKNKDVLKGVSRIIFARHVSKKGFSIEEKSSKQPIEGKFFLLSDFEKAVCFLKYRMSLNVADISQVVDMNSYEVISALGNSKFFLTGNGLNNLSEEFL